MLPINNEIKRKCYQSIMKSSENATNQQMNKNATNQ